MKITVKIVTQIEAMFVAEFAKRSNVQLNAVLKPKPDGSGYP